MNYHQIFLNAIQDKIIVKVRFNSQEKGIIERLCIPFDFGPSRRQNLVENPDRYHFYDLDSPERQHTLSILPNQIISIEATAKSFDPAQYITWTPKWFIKRDWGIYS
ncbi:MAG TPA: hypothetical protein VLK22_00835 [Candidatus Udaeobacter sp.]|nr:hypothetical protein [Candidatus Udaeobacter sp.]